ncbi:MAG TPA: hypothetical protein VFP39_10135 [Gemmatimonadales bacterium]|nr:hypothetical protein [Gemmatimonadales bacterium]
MRCFARTFATVVLVLACKAPKSAEERASDLQTCSALSTAPLEIAQCLQGRGGWSETAADSAASQRARELDSVKSQIGQITAAADSQHAAEIRSCDQRLVDMKTCLITRYGWEENQATAIDDSVWNSAASEHVRQIQNCSGRRGVGTGACLQLHYKWLPRRALALDDSIRRANLN